MLKAKKDLISMTTQSLKQELESCLEQLEDGTLTPQRLQQVIDKFPKQMPDRKQELLIVQAKGSSLTMELLGYSIYRGGKNEPSPEQLNPHGKVTDDASSWPYKTVADAFEDGWRVISFPNSALMMDDTTTHGLGFEYILERWR